MKEFTHTLDGQVLDVFPNILTATKDEARRSALEEAAKVADRHKCCICNPTCAEELRALAFDGRIVDALLKEEQK